MEIIGFLMLFVFCTIIVSGLYVATFLMAVIVDQELVSWKDITAKAAENKSVGNFFQIVFMFLWWAYSLPLKGIMSIMDKK